MCSQLGLFCTGETSFGTGMNTQWCLWGWHRDFDYMVSVVLVSGGMKTTQLTGSCISTQFYFIITIEWRYSPMGPCALSTPKGIDGSTEYWSCYSFCLLILLLNLV